MAKQQEEEFEFVSLMDLAQTDTSDIEGKAFEEQAEGIYIISLTEARFTQLDDKDGMPRAMLFHVGVVEYYEPLDEESSGAKDPEKMVGTRFRQGTFVDLADVPAAIARIKGRMYEMAKFPTVGAPGGVEGVDPGWIDGPIGERIAIRVRTRAKDDGSVRTYYDWLSPKALAKTNLDWSELQRPALNPKGEEEEIEEAA